MRHIIITCALVAAALAITFGVGAMLEQTAFRTGPEPGVGLPTGTPAPVDRHGRSLLRPHEA
mgnify:CR=1 FL=1|jgi:hypothetical protein